MSDHQDDDLVRDALHADAAGVTADDALLDRIKSLTSPRTAASSRRRVPWLVAAAAALAVLAGSAGVLAGRDNDQTVDLVDDPRTTTPIDIDDVSPTPAESCAASDAGKVLLVFMSTTATDADIAEMSAHLETAQNADDTAIDSVRYVDRAEALEAVQQRPAGSDRELDSLTLERVPTYFVVTMPPGTDDVRLRGEVADLPGVLGTTSTDCAGLSTSTADRPAQIVAVTEQGHVVVVDSSTGDVIRDLGGFDDPTDPAVADREGGAYSITGVALHPNGRDAYFETCCEPAAGAIFRVPIDGSVPIDPQRLEALAYGYGIDISADGRWLAFASISGPVLRDLATGDEVQTEAQDGFTDLVQVAVNHDGTEVTVERALEYDTENGPFYVRRSELITFRRDGGTLTRGETTGGDVRLLPIYSSGGTELTTVTARDGLIDLNVDATGRWFLATPWQMPLRGYSEAADEEEILGSYAAADW